MKTYHLKSAQVLRRAGLTQVVFLFLIWTLTNTCFGAPQTNNIGWSDDFTNYTNTTPLIEGTNGWYSDPSFLGTSIVQNIVFNSGNQAALIAPGDTLSNSFVGQPARNVKLEMYVLPQLWTSSVYLALATNAAAQFFINSNGYFMVGNGGNWNEASNSPAISITNINNSTNFVRIQINLQYNTHTWSLKAWTNVNNIVVSTNGLGFTTNINCFSGFTIDNGSITSYVDDVSVTRFEGPIKINGVSFDQIRRVDGAWPIGKINGVNVR